MNEKLIGKTVEYGLLPDAKRSIGTFYEDPYEAEMEFTDNSIGLGKNVAGAKDPKRPLVVSVRLETITTPKGKRGKITNTDIRGVGGDEQTIVSFINKGQSARQGYGWWGFAAAAAAYYFQCDNLQVRAQPPRQQVLYETEIAGYGNNSTGLHGTTIIKESYDETRLFTDPRFEVALDGIPLDRMPKEAPLIARLSELYSPLLCSKGETGEGNIVKNPKPRHIIDKKGQVAKIHDKIILLVNGEQVEPIAIPLEPISRINEDGQVEIFNQDSVRYFTTKKGETIWFWAGKLPEGEQNKEIKKKFRGMRIYINGRLFGIDDFGLSQEEDRFALLTGEIHLDNVDKEALFSQTQVNKSRGINKNSGEWQRLRNEIRGALETYGILDAIGRTEIKPMENKPQHLTEAVEKAKIKIVSTLSSLREDPEFRELIDLIWAPAIGIITIGQPAPEPTGVDRITHLVDPDRKRTRRHGTPWQEQQARTIIPPNADSRWPRKRFAGIFNDVELGPFTDPKGKVDTERSYRVGPRPAPSNPQELVLSINSENPNNLLALHGADTVWPYMDRIFYFTSDWLTRNYPGSDADRQRDRDRIYLQFAQSVTKDPEWLAFRLGFKL